MATTELSVLAHTAARGQRVFHLLHATPVIYSASCSIILCAFGYIALLACAGAPTYGRKSCHFKLLPWDNRFLSCGTTLG